MEKPIEQIHGEAWAALHREYRHLEMMATTIAAGQTIAQWAEDGFYELVEASKDGDVADAELMAYIARETVALARAIQEEVRREG